MNFNAYFSKRSDKTKELSYLILSILSAVFAIGINIELFFKILEGVTVTLKDLLYNILITIPLFYCMYKSINLYGFYEDKSD